MPSKKEWEARMGMSGHELDSEASELESESEEDGSELDSPSESGYFSSDADILSEKAG